MIKLSIYLMLLFLLQSASFVSADTVYFGDGTEEKGIVVENYHDRIVLNTIDGEKQISRGDIKDILYDRREQNLLKLGDFHQAKGNKQKAYEYYKKAYELNPEYKEAKDKFMHLRSIILRTPEKQLRSDMERMQALFKQSGKVYDSSNAKKDPITRTEELKSTTGLVLTMESGMPTVASVDIGSPAKVAGIDPNDQITALWGKVAGYLDLDTIIDMIIESSSSEIAITLKRKIEITDKSRSIADFGMSLDVKEQGLFVSGVTQDSRAAYYNIFEDDLIADINGESTRYMPLKVARKNINRSLSGGNLDLAIIRDVVLWRKEL